MKRINYLSLCTLALVVLGCAKDNLVKTESQSVANVTLSCVAEQQIDDNATKTAIGTGNTIVWSASDKLSVLSFTSSSNNDQFSLTSGAGNVSGSFNGTLTPDATQYYALYPYSSDASYDGTKVSFKLPQNQTYAAGSFGNGANPSIAAFTDPSENLSFKNVCGVFKLSLTGSVTVTKIAISDESGKMIWGDASLAADEYVGTDSQSLTLVDGNNTIYLTNINETLSGTAKNFYFVAPMGSFANGFTAYVYTSAGIYTYLSTTKANTISRSKIMAMPEASVSAPSSKDLGGNSNCFIVPCAGTYTFTANKGKGGDAITPESVEVLWETVNTTTTPTVGDVINSVSSTGTTISFTATGVAGNGVIAAKVAGEIVWSWHIWSTAAPIEVKKITKGGAYWMDRNLGALLRSNSNPLANGLFYQWGRKDPLLGAYAHGVMISATNGVEITKEVVTSVTGTIEYSIQNPTKLMVNNSTWANATGWLENNSDIVGLWSDPSKTAYDPCPSGYVVPNYSKAPMNDTSIIQPIVDRTELYPNNGWLGYSKFFGAQVSAMNVFFSSLVFEDGLYLTQSFQSSRNFLANAARGVRCIKE